MARERSLAELIYATFIDEVAFSIRDIKTFLKSGGSLSELEIQAILDKVYINFAYELEENDIPNLERWLVKGERKLESVEARLYSQSTFRDVIATNEPDDLINVEEGYIEIEGEMYPIISDIDYRSLGLSGRKRRKRLIVSFAELAEYVRGVPYVEGIEIVYNVSGTITGYRVWMEK